MKRTVNAAPLDGNLAKNPKATKVKVNPVSKVLQDATSLAGGIMVGTVPVELITVEESYQRYLRPITWPKFRPIGTSAKAAS